MDANHRVPRDPSARTPWCATSRSGSLVSTPRRSTPPSACTRRRRTSRSCWAHRTVVVGSPFSGHGFKFTPAIGRRLAKMAGWSARATGSQKERVGDGQGSESRRSTAAPGERGGALAPLLRAVPVRRDIDRLFITDAILAGLLAIYVLFVGSAWASAADAKPGASLRSSTQTTAPSSTSPSLTWRAGPRSRFAIEARGSGRPRADLFASRPRLHAADLTLFTRPGLCSSGPALGEGVFRVVWGDHGVWSRCRRSVPSLGGS